MPKNNATGNLIRVRRFGPSYSEGRAFSAHAAVDFIAGHCVEPPSVSAVANAVRLSASRLAHVFPEATGLAVMDHVARLRVNIARRLLLETSDTLDKIAARLGFADASNFSRTFKGIGGIAPGEFRRSRHSGVSQTRH